MATKLSKGALQALQELQDLAEVEGKDEFFELGYRMSILEELDFLIDSNIRGEYRITDTGREALASGVKQS